MTEPSNVVSLQERENSVWIESYQQARMTSLDEATVDAYLRILRQFTEWVAKRPGHGKHFQPEQLTITVIEGYLSLLKEQGYSVSHRTRVKSVLKHFCQWLIDEKEVLKRNPASGIEIQAQQQLAPRVLNPINGSSCGIWSRRARTCVGRHSLLWDTGRDAVSVT